jgi:hypothetical protein
LRIRVLAGGTSHRITHCTYSEDGLVRHSRFAAIASATPHLRKGCSRVQKLVTEKSGSEYSRALIPA